MLIKKIINLLNLEKTENYSFEQNLFISISLIVSIFTIFAFLFDIILRHDLLMSANSFLASIIYLVIFILSFRGMDYQKLIPIFISGFVVLLALTYFLFGGYYGGTVLFMLGGIIAITIFSSRATSIFTFSILIFLTMLFFILQYNYPELVINYNSESERFYDYLISTALSMTAIFFLIYKLVNKYRIEKELLIKEKNIVENQHNIIQDKNIILSESAKMKDKMFSVVSHDLKTPVMAFSEGLLILEEDFAKMSDSEKIGMIRSLRRNAGAINELLDNLLAWSRFQKGKFEKHPSYLRINELIDFSIELYRQRIENKKIIIEKKYHIEPQIWADYNMMSIIINNLISNAIKYSFENSKIIINMEADNGFLAVSIKDHGTGIPENIINDIFKLEGEKSSFGTSGERGVGLGLVLCNEFVSLNKGKIYCESKNGEGSIFYFTVPLSDNDVD